MHYCRLEHTYQVYFYKVTIVGISISKFETQTYALNLSVKYCYDIQYKESVLQVWTGIKPVFDMKVCSDNKATCPLL